MAEQAQGDRGVLPLAGAVVAAVGHMIASIYRAATRDGTIDAFLRQGTDEIGRALVAFPESIQVDEPGSVFNPLYSDIAVWRKQANPAAGQTAMEGSSKRSVHGESPQAGKQGSASPSDIVQSSRPQVSANGAGPQAENAPGQSPSQIVEASRPQGSVYGTPPQAEDKNVQSPSDIAQDRKPYVPEPNRDGDTHRHGIRM